MESYVLVVNVFGPDGHLEATSCLLDLLATRLGDHLVAAMVDADSTVSTLLPLLHQTIDEGATVIAPCGASE